MAKKKNKKNIAKRKAKGNQRKAQKRKLRLVKAKQNKKQSQSRHDHLPASFDYPPLMSDEPPAGFRAIGMSAAMMEFAKAMIKHPDLKELESMEKTIGLAMPLWNYAIATEMGEVNTDMRSECCKELQQVCHVNQQEAEVLIDKMVILKNEMFPPDVQPQGSPIMFMRKGVSHIIAPFNYDRLLLNDEILPETEDDRRLLGLLADLDRMILDSAEDGDYDSWQEKYHAMEKQCGIAFKAWLAGKGVTGEFYEDCAYLAAFFVNFVYQYGHDNVGILRNTDELYFEEFFYDFVLRKVIMEPNEHVDWVPALRLFFTFLAEKGYLDDAGPYVIPLDTFEKPFLQLLRQEYG